MSTLVCSIRIMHYVCSNTRVLQVTWTGTMKYPHFKVEIYRLMSSVYKLIFSIGFRILKTLKVFSFIQKHAFSSFLTLSQKVPRVSDL